MSPMTPQSKTLPRNFEFHYTNGQIPRTPEQKESPFGPRAPRSHGSYELPTEPPIHSRLRIRRRRPFNTHFSDFDGRPPLPTIDTSRWSHASPIVPSSEAHGGFLASFSSASLGHRIFSLKTPLAQITTAFAELPAKTEEWSLATSQKGKSISRPASTWSETSDSSASSLSSSDTFLTYGESCTSPESDSTDPFIFAEARRKPPLLSSPMPLHLQRPSKRPKLHTTVKWTVDMEEHLWMTYMTYLADPTVTPFKMLPGTAPPLGVCHRVARAAKRSWKGPRITLESIAEDQQSHRFGNIDTLVMRRESSVPLDMMRGADSPDTIRPDPVFRSHSSNELSRKPFIKWPRSESFTRRQLRILCKRKPTLSPHYQRMMQTRSPSPFDSSSSRSRPRSSRFTSSPPRRDFDFSFSTRNLNVSLATSTANSMQLGCPLSQLASEELTPHRNDNDWSTQPASRTTTHHKSQSLQLGLGLGSNEVNDFRRLASPFQEIPKNRNWLAMAESIPQAQRDYETISSAPPKPGPPTEIHAPRPLSGSMKRRAQYQLGEELLSDDTDTRRNFLEDLFRDSDSNGKMRVRSRGFSMGAMSQGPPPRPLAELFSPPSAHETSNLENFHIAGMESNILPPSHGDYANRLGSPFAPTFANSGFSNTFPRSLFPQGLDSIAAFEQQRLDPFWSDVSSPLRNRR